MTVKRKLPFLGARNSCVKDDNIAELDPIVSAFSWEWEVSRNSIGLGQGDLDTGLSQTHCNGPWRVKEETGNSQEKKPATSAAYSKLPNS